MKKNIMIALLLAIGLGQIAPVMAMRNQKSWFPEGISEEDPLHASLIDLQQGQSASSDRSFGGDSEERGRFSFDYDREGEGDPVIKQRTYRDVVKSFHSFNSRDVYYHIKLLLYHLSSIKENSAAIAAFFATEVQEDLQGEACNTIVVEFIKQFCETIKSDYEDDRYLLKFDYIKNLNDEELLNYSVQNMAIEQIKRLFTQNFNYLDHDFDYHLFRDFELTLKDVQEIVDDPRVYFILLIVKKKNELEEKDVLEVQERQRCDQYKKILEHNLDKVSLDALNLPSKNVSSPSTNVGFASLGVATASLTKDVMASYNKEVKKLLAEKQQKAEADKKFKGKRITLTRSEKARCALAMLQKHTNPKNIKANKMFWAAAVVVLGSLLYNKTSSFKMPEFAMLRFGGQGESDDEDSDYEDEE